MQTYCKYSSLPLVSESITTGLGIKGKDYIVAWEHPLFSKPLHLVLEAATAKPLSSMSSKQRYLLFLVLATKTKLFRIKHPVSMDLVPDTICISYLPLLIGAATKILLNKKEWDSLTNPCILPSMEYRADNCRNFNWDYLIKQCISKSTIFLTYSNPREKVMSRLISESLEYNELESEHILAHTLTNTIPTTKQFQFNLNHVRTTLALHEKELKEHGKPAMSPKTKDAILKLFVTDTDKVHIPIREIINIKRAFTQYLDQAINETNIVYREAYGMTIKKLDQLIVDLTAKSRLFDDAPKKANKDIIAANKPASISYTLDKPESENVNSALHQELAEIESKLAACSNPKLAQLLKLRKAAITQQIAMQEF